MESDCSEGVNGTLEQSKVLCKERGELYEEQQEIKHQIKITKEVFRR